MIAALGLLLTLASGLGTLCKRLRLPIIISFFLAGFFLSKFSTLASSQGIEFLSPLSKIGVVFLLFLVGLKLNPRDLSLLGKKIVALGLLQFAVTSTVFAFILSRFFDISFPQLLIFSAALSFSSTIVVSKLIFERREQDELYAKISFGVLILQDLLAIVIIIVANTFDSPGNNVLFLNFLSFLIKAVAASLVFLLSLKFLPKIEKIVGSDNESLFLFSVAFCLLLAAFFEAIGVGLELGALSAGILLSPSIYQREISSRAEPIKNIFLAVYFAYLGSQLNVNQVFSDSRSLIGILLFLILVVRPLITYCLITLLGFSKNVSFKAALALSQISEFTIIVIVAAKLGASVISPTIALFVITVIVSSLLLENSFKLSRLLKLQSRKGLKTAASGHAADLSPEIILLGAHRLGGGLISNLDHLSQNLLVVDNNPEVITQLKIKNVPCVFGDANDVDFLESVATGKLKMFVSTVPSVETNLLILNF